MDKTDLTEGEVLAALEEAASMQWGLITTAQAKSIGIERLWLSRLVDRNVVFRVRHGVYALPSLTHGLHQDLQAAWLATDRGRLLEERVMAGNDVVVSHSSAAHVHNIGDLVASNHEFSSAQRHQPAQSDVRFHKRQFAEDEVVLVDGLPTTSITRTLADLASQHVDFDHLAQAVRDAFEMEKTRHDDLSSGLSKSARAYGFKSGEAIVDALLAEAGWRPTVETIKNRFGTAAWQEVLQEAFESTLDQRYIATGLQQALKSMQSDLLSSSDIASHLPKYVEEFTKNTNAITPSMQQALLSNRPGVERLLKTPESSKNKTLGEEDSHDEAE